MALETSSDLQKLVLSSIVNDSNLFGNVIDDLGTNFFSDNSYQFIYKMLYRYYKQYAKAPPQQELMYMIQQNHNEVYGPIIDIANEADAIYRTKSANPAFVISSIETFIKRAKFESLMADAVHKYESDKTFTLDTMMGDFIQAYNYQITDVDCMQLDDYAHYSKLREDLFGSIDKQKIIKSCLPSLNNKLTYKGYKVGDLITVIAAPGVGKTAFLINEGLYASKQGFNVLHIYLSDMNEITASHRYMACMTGIPINVYTENPENYHNVLLQDPGVTTLGWLARIKTVMYDVGTITADRLRAIVFKLQEKKGVHFDLVIVDYADNLIAESDQMYQSGGEIYNKLKSLAGANKCVVMTASQPKQQYFDSEIIPFAGVAESSKKLHVVDIALTFGKPVRSANIGTLHLAKMREGETGGIIRLGLDMAVSRVVEITEPEYLKRKAEIYADPISNAVRKSSQKDDE